MALTLTERINFSFKGWLGVLGSLNTDYGLTFYEEPYSNDIIVKASQVWLQDIEIPPATTITEARLNSTLYPLLIKDLSQPLTAVHLTPDVSGKLFFATTAFNDLSTRIFNFIEPQIVPVPGAYASIGYMVRIYNGNPYSGGTEITTTVGAVGSSPGWLFMFGAGALIIADDFTNIIDINDVWLTGFQYIGLTTKDIINHEILNADEGIIVRLQEEALSVTAINTLSSLSRSPTNINGELLPGAQLIINNLVYHCENTDDVSPSNKGFSLGDLSPTSPNDYRQVTWNNTKANKGFNLKSTDIVIARYFYEEVYTIFNDGTSKLTLNCDIDVYPGDVVYLSNNNYVSKADNRSIDTAEVIGIVLSKNSPTECIVVTYGQVAVFYGLEFNKPFFLGENGSITRIVPTDPNTVMFKLGRALNSYTLFVNIDNNLVIRA